MLKRLLILSSLMAALQIMPIHSLADSKEVSLITEPPTQKYTVISPLSEEGKSMEKIYKKIKERAKDLNADAIIDWKCTQHVSGVTFHNCSGLAIKWVN
jgi:hypothetical protein